MNDNVTNENSNYRPGTGDIRLRINVPAKQPFLPFNRIVTKGGGFVSVDWGDGNTETFTGETTYSPEHTYAKAGEYIVKLTGSKFTEVGGSTGGISFRTAVREILSLKMPTDSTNVSLRCAFKDCTRLMGNIPEWDDSITDAEYTYYNCVSLTGGIPEWGTNITDAYATYKNCPGLTGRIPEWGAKITNASSTYWGCSRLTGGIPEWGTNIILAGYTYNNCAGLTGNIPEWGTNITNVAGTYKGCAHLTGNIPEWGAKIEYAYYTYLNCKGLTGCSEELLQDPMPSTIAQYADCVYGCVDEIRQHFTKDWGGNKRSRSTRKEKTKQKLAKLQTELKRRGLS